MKMLNSKKGQGHVEFILSFVLFIGVILFIFVFINPFTKVKQANFIDDSEKAILNSISEEVRIIPVIVKQENGCYYYSGDYLEVQESLRKYSLYDSDVSGVFTNKKDNNLQSCLSEDYKIGVIRKENMIVYEKIEGLIEEYNTDYNELRNTLSLKNNFLFSFKLIGGDDELSAVREIPGGVNVYVKEKPLRVINKDGLIRDYKLSVRAWN